MNAYEEQFSFKKKQIKHLKFEKSASKFKISSRFSKKTELPNTSLGNIPPTVFEPKQKCGLVVSPSYAGAKPEPASHSKV